MGWTPGMPTDLANGLLDWAGRLDTAWNEQIQAAQLAAQQAKLTPETETTWSTGQIPQAPITDAEFKANIREASEHKGDLSWFYSKVKTGGDWDDRKYGGKYEDFGNFHYGVVGSAAGFTPDLLLVAAGLYQVKSGTSAWDWVLPNGTPPFVGFPFGDDPRDSVQIFSGVLYSNSIVTGGHR